MCAALANFARLLATQELNPSTLSPFLVCQLIALDKRPGVRPIGVCDVARRIVAKAILQVVDRDIEEACGYLQKCSGLPAGLEAAVHAMQEIHDDESTEGVLFVDAKNAFNSLNRAAALHNVRHICPALGMVLQNYYCALHGCLYLVEVSCLQRRERRRATPCLCRFTHWPLVLSSKDFWLSIEKFAKHGWLMTQQGPCDYRSYVLGGTLCVLKA